MKRYLTIQNAALVVFIILACLVSMEVGQRITLKTRVIIGTKNNVELSFYEKAIQSFLDLNKNPFHIIKSYGKISRPDMIKDEALVVGKDKSEFNLNYLYVEPVSEIDDSSIITLRNLSTNKIIHQWHVVGDDSLPYIEAPILYDKDKVIVRVRGTISSTGKLTSSSKPLLCLDKNSNIVWKQDSIMTHHSIEIGPEGDVWTCSRAQIDTGNQRQYRNDQILQIDGETGKVIYAKRIHDIFIENPKFDLSHLKNNISDRYHLNDIQPALTTTKYWKKGDIFISLRHISTVFLFRPSTNKILWAKTGFMGYQHDVNFIDSSKISIFDNNLFKKIEGQFSRYVDGTNQILIYDFSKDSTFIKYKNIFNEHNIATETNGRGRLIPNDSVLYVESTDEGFFTLSNLKTGVTKKFIIPHPKEKGKLSNLRWFPVYLPEEVGPQLKSEPKTSSKESL